MRLSTTRTTCVAVLGICIMAVMLAFGFIHGDFTAEGSVLLQLPWGRATLVDVYVGLMLFSCWVFRRERSVPVAALWTAAILATGNIATCCYVLRALTTSGNTAAGFWLGDRRET